MNQKSKLCVGLYCVFASHLIIAIILFANSMYRLNHVLLPAGVFYYLISFLYPPILWIWSTDIEIMNYHRIKSLTYGVVVLHETLLLASLLFKLLSQLFLPGFLQIRTDEIFTKDMVLFLARLVTQLPVCLLIFLLMRSFLRPLRDEKSKNQILGFKLSHLRTRANSGTDIAYPLTIAKDIATGKDVVVSEKDRFLHTLIDGTSGTGKTSSTILPAIRNDLNMRCKAAQKQKEALEKLHQRTNKADMSNFLEKTRQIHLQYPVCGITVLAPEDSLTDDVCRLCEARNIPYHRIDATRTLQGKKKSGWIGMNPFYLSSNLTDDFLQTAIVKKAVVFSDVMQVITDLKGKADSYFTGLNRQMISNLAILVMYTIPLLHKRQATPLDLQLLINNFDLLPPYVSKLEEIDKEHRRYTFIIQYIREELLGKGRSKMEDQSRGTRNIINEFLLMPGSREIYCTQNSIDFDQILENGEVTVCNYDLASGDTNAVAFGLFFLLSFNNAVLSRPGTEHTRIPHFFYIDELPVLIHSSLEKNFSLFRKFRVAMFCAIQTLDQFEKNDITKYLKGVILGCAHIMIFGRSSLSDMEVFSAMAGVRDDTEEQTTVSQTALSSDSPLLSYSTREIMAQKNNLEEIDIRMKDFQEVTFFTTQDGRPLPPIHAKVSFLKDSDWKEQGYEIFPYGQYDILESSHSTTQASDSSDKSDSPNSASFVLKQLSEYRISGTGTRSNLCAGTETVTAPLPSEQIHEITENNKEAKTLSSASDSSHLPEGSESLDGLF